ncbi:MAG: hypothetical protein V7L29_19190 [Nostoc sp.]|uniref:hypothetical protein n=1 Tax=Nostoc sp. TaxID=1180 RepID=UPI002FFAC5E4
MQDGLKRLAVLTMKEVMRGQYGSDSDQAQAVGLKKKSDRSVLPVKKPADGVTACWKRWRTRPP